MDTTRIEQAIRAPRERVYEALVDPDAVQAWMVPDGMTSQTIEFETDDPSMQGEMTATYTLTDTDEGTLLVGVHENLPPGLSRADNELGWSMSLAKLAALVEQDS